MVRARLIAAWTLLTASIIGWPLSSYTFAKNEPPVVLALSWLAVILTCAEILSSTDVRKQQEKQHQDG